jgi:hypothetical protein
MIVKRIFFCCLFLSVLASLWAEKPRRYVEFGVDVDAGAANNFIKLSDVFNEEQTIVIDTAKLSELGLRLGVAAEAEGFFNINFGEKFGLGFFAGVELSLYTDIYKDLFQLISAADAGSEDLTATMSAGASAFADVGLRTIFKSGKLSFGFSPAAYVPLLYMPPPEVSARINTSSGIKVDAVVNAGVYTAVPLDKFLDVSSFSSSGGSGGGQTGDVSFGMNDIWGALEGWGLDASFDAEYACNPRWDLGASVGNLPLYPARLRYGAQFQTTYPLDFETDELLADLLAGNEIDLPPPDQMDITFSDDLAFQVFRPLRFDFYAAWKPFSTNLIVLRPNIGFSALTVYGYEGDKMCFNAGLEAQLNLKRVFSLALTTGYREKIWHHGLGLMLNLRVLQLDLGVALQSPDFAGSFRIQGAGVVVGLRLGF